MKAHRTRICLPNCYEKRNQFDHHIFGLVQFFFACPLTAASSGAIELSRLGTPKERGAPLQFRTVTFTGWAESAPHAGDEECTLL